MKPFFSSTETHKMTKINGILFVKLNQQEKLIQLKWPPLKRITLGKHKSDNNNGGIRINSGYCVLIRYN